MLTKADLYNPLVIDLKFPDQIQIKFIISLNDAYSYLNSEVIWSIPKYLNFRIFTHHQLMSNFLCLSKFILKPRRSEN